MARPRLNPPSKMLSIRFPLELLDQLRTRGEVTAQIVEAVRTYLDVLNDMPAKPSHKPVGEHQAP